MMSKRYFNGVFLMGAVLFLAGCGARYDPFFANHIKAADQALISAQGRGADKRCAPKYQALVNLRDNAEKTYMACNYYQAKKMTGQVVDRANALQCPVQVAAKPAPPAPKDSDGDGVFDDKDQCPGTPRGARVDSRGCWVLSGVLFDTNQTTIKPNFRKMLDEAVTVMKNNPGLRVEIQGHTDSRGSDRYNMNLSNNRAQAVMGYFVGKGISRGRLSFKGFGKSRPAASNSTDAGRAKNRRVELKPKR